MSFFQKLFGGEKSPKSWYQESMRKAENGDAEAQSLVASCLFKGFEVIQDEVEAAKWFRKAAEQGNAYSQYWLGVCLKKGIGVPADKPIAVEWFRKAAEQGNAFAQESLAMCLMTGRGVAKNEAEAVEWMRKAEQGHAGSQSRQVDALDLPVGGWQRLKARHGGAAIDL